MEREITCSVSKCDAKVLARGWCRKHYLRWYKYGNVETVHKPSEYVSRGEASPNYRHGMWNHPLYGTWSHILDRCYNTKNKAYRHYGGRGITVCERWRDIRNFIEDMGEKPDGYSIERIDNAKGYSPDNCIWANATKQSRNRRYTKLTYEKAEKIRSLPRVAKNGRGEGYTRLEIAEMYGVSVATVKKVLSGEYWRSAEKVVREYKK